MTQSVLKRNALEAFDRANNPNAIKYNLNDLDNDFEYLFQTSSLPVYGIGWGRTNNLSASIDRGQLERDIPSDSMSIPNDPFAEAAM